MPTFKPVIRGMRSDGYGQVYIRVTHNRAIGYIKTDKMVAQSDLSKKGEIKDSAVSKYCSEQIYYYNSLLNDKDTTAMSLQEVIQYITTANTDICFSDYATRHIDKMFNEGHERNSRTYRLAVNNLERYLGTTKVMCAHLTPAVLTRWIESLGSTHRAKEQYPVCVRQIYKAALLDFNDESKGIVRIKNNPWARVKIPKADRTTKHAITAEEAREFFFAPLPPTKQTEPLSELGQDVAKLVLCLAGINTIDLFGLQKSDYKKGVIGYKRAKTRSTRRDEAYFEIQVEPILYPLMEKYKTAPNDPYLLNFHKRFCDADSFNANVNTGIKQICKSMGLPKETWYSVYTFRYTWATVAQNDCAANIAEVGFGMNHSGSHTVTRGYIMLDFSPAWELNAKVIDFIFFSTARSKQGLAKDVDEPKEALFRISKKKMVEGTAYFKGEILAHVQDIGFGTVNDVIKELVKQLPDTIPHRTIVQFRIRNVDSGKEVFYERMKGKGF